MDEDRPQKATARKGPRPDREGPRGRGLGAPTGSVFRCSRCGEKQDVAATAASEAVCASCGSALHSCSNCRHFDSSARFECRVEIPQRVASKTKANDCDAFQAKLTAERPADAPSTNDARSAFDALFK